MTDATEVTPADLALSAALAENEQLRSELARLNTWRRSMIGVLSDIHRTSAKARESLKEALELG